ncbi:MAG: SPOR domain-containing protein [Gemmatimonadaceae bacterium]|nr:SPOR domain-containing protein [Gemmatimonadaceae bacterium]
MSMRRTGFVVLALVASALGAQNTPTRPTAPVFLRAQQLVNDGDGAAGRALTDSVLKATAEGQLPYAEALFWHAVLAADATVTARELLRLSIEYPQSPRAEDALLRLAQLELLRGDRDAVRRHLDRLVRDHPSGTSRGAAAYWRGRVEIEDGRLDLACAAFDSARTIIATSDVELRNQLEFHARACANRVMAPVLTPAPIPVADSSPRTREPVAPAAAARGRWSVQVAAFAEREGATALVKKLTKRGLDARVTADRPWRVRVGRYPTRERAVEVAKQLSSKASKAIVVEAER